MSSIRVVLLAVILVMGLWLIAIVAHADVAPRSKDRKCIDRAHFAMVVAKTRVSRTMTLAETVGHIEGLPERHPELDIDQHELAELIACLRRVWVQALEPEAAFEAEWRGCMAEASA